MLSKGEVCIKTRYIHNFSYHYKQITIHLKGLFADYWEQDYHEIRTFQSRLKCHQKQPLFIFLIVIMYYQTKQKHQSAYINQYLDQLTQGYKYA